MLLLVVACPRDLLAYKIVLLALIIGVYLILRDKEHGLPLDA